MRDGNFSSQDLEFDTIVNYIQMAFYLHFDYTKTQKSPKSARFGAF
jgi:hypothetical protein